MIEPVQTSAEAAVLGMLAKQKRHRLVPLMELASDLPDEAGRWCIRTAAVPETGLESKVEWMNGAELVAAYKRREALIFNSGTDPFHYGFFYRSWDDVLWDLAEHRAEHPGVPITYGVAGSNGAAKTYMMARFYTLAMEQTEPDWPEHQRLFFTFSVDDTQSAAIIESAIRFWQPQDYKTESGRMKTLGTQKLAYNPATGFTNDEFALRSGAKIQFRTWKQDIAKLEGVRPVTAWSDEGVPVAVMEAMEKRLLTAAEETLGWCPKWRVLLKEKAGNPGMWFPRELIGRLMVGVHFVTYTFKDGYTETVRWLIDKGTVLKRIEADPELLPRRDAKTGEILGGELLPALMRGLNPTVRVKWLYAWQNPLGGNWMGMKASARTKRRDVILWQCYGIAEGSADTPFPNFNVQLHARPCPSWLPRVGTWAQVVDPVASGGRCWFMLWAIICGEHWRGLSPGDWFIAHEYPQQNDHVPGIGSGEVCRWALPGDKGGQRGPAQKEWPVGFNFRASEIRRIEAKLARWQGLDETKTNEEDSPLWVPPGYRIMDSRAANTDKENESGSATLIDHMLEKGLAFVPAGRDSGAAQGETRVQPGEQKINDMLMWDRDLAELDEKTGWLDIPLAKGFGPRIRIAEHCTNLIEALQNYPGIANGGASSAYKDPIDCLRYLAIARLEHIDQAAMDEFNDSLSCRQ